MLPFQNKQTKYLQTVLLEYLNHFAHKFLSFMWSDSFLNFCTKLGPSNNFSNRYGLTVLVSVPCGCVYVHVPVYHGIASK